LEFIKISPVNLVESERDFIKQLDKYLENIEFDEIYLLRNPSRKGIGFFETKNFYPDFILWIIKGDQQIITFIEPHGLIMTDYDDEKLSLYKEIKNMIKVYITDNIPDAHLVSNLLEGHGISNRLSIMI